MNVKYSSQRHMEFIKRFGTWHSMKPERVSSGAQKRK